MSYHESNLNILFSKIISEKGDWWSKNLGEIYGSAKDIYEGDRMRIDGFFKFGEGSKIKLGDISDDIIMFIKKNPILA